MLALLEFILLKSKRVSSFLSINNAISLSQGPCKNPYSQGHPILFITISPKWTLFKLYLIKCDILSHSAISCFADIHPKFCLPFILNEIPKWEIILCSDFPILNKANLLSSSLKITNVNPLNDNPHLEIGRM